MLETRVSGAVKDAETRNEMKLQQNRNSLLFFSYVGCVIVVRDLFISFIFILIKWCAQIAISSKTNRYGNDVLETGLSQFNSDSNLVGRNEWHRMKSCRSCFSMQSDRN